jgi:hypothetical protein
MQTPSIVTNACDNIYNLNHPGDSTHYAPQNKPRVSVNPDCLSSCILETGISRMNCECLGLLFSFFVISFFSRSIFYVIKNKITIHFACIYTLYYVHYICTYYRVYTKAYTYGPFKGFSRVILIICNFGFTCCL